MNGKTFWMILIAVLLLALRGAAIVPDDPVFRGKFYDGDGDVEYLRLLDISRRMFTPDAEWQNVAMLYTPSWNGWVEGPTWRAWWVQNSYGPTYCALPFFEEPLTTFLQNAQDLWFDQMGDGQRIGNGRSGSRPRRPALRLRLPDVHSQAGGWKCRPSMTGGSSSPRPVC